MTTQEEFLIERSFGKYGDALGGTLSVEATHEELKELSRQDVGQSDTK